MNIFELYQNISLDTTLKYNKHGRPVSDNPKAKLYVISTDTDGVLANWVKSFLDIFNKMFKTNIIQDQWISDTPWELNPPLMTKKQFEEAYDVMLKTPEFYLHLEPYDNIAFDKINSDLENALYNCYVVTVRTNLLAKEGIQDTTQLLTRWVRAQGITNVTGCNSGGDDRPKLLEQLGVDFHLDDFIKQVEKINAHGKTKAFLMDRPWNRQFDVGDLRVYSFDDFLMRTVFAKEMEGKTE